MAKRRYRMTESRIAKLLKEGRGEGIGGDYKPWLTIHDVSSLGRSHRIRGAKTGRIHHYLSDLEMAVHLDLDWAPEVLDIREQYPLPRVETMLIASRAGIRHPQDRGTDVVMTTDFLVDVTGLRGPSKKALSAKYAADLENARVLEKLEIERRYWAARDVPWSIVTERERSRQRVLTLGWLHEWRWLDGLKEPRPGWWVDACGAVFEALGKRPSRDSLSSFLLSVDRRNGWQPGTALSAFRHLAANRFVLIDVDTFDPLGPASQLRLEEGRGFGARAA